MTRIVRLEDVARRANVSVSTASQALNGKGRVRASTRTAIQRIAAEMKYVPDRVARGLATGRTTLLGIQVSGFSDNTLVPGVSYFTELLNAASDASIARGYSLVAVPPRCSTNSLQSMGLAGGIVLDPQGTESLAILRDTQSPIVAVGEPVDGFVSDAVVSNDYELCIRMLLNHLHRSGRRRPMLVVSSSGVGYVTVVVDGYRSWCAEQGARPHVIEVPDSFGPDERYRLLCEVMTLRDPECDSVVVSLDTLALDVAKARRYVQSDVRRDLSIVSLIDSPTLAWPDPGITALDLQPAELGRIAVELLVDAIESGRSEGSMHLVEPLLVLRDSISDLGGHV